MTSAIAIICALAGCVTYHVAKDDRVRRTELTLLGSEIAAGAAFGTAVYLKSKPSERLPLAANIVIGVGLALLVDLAIAGIAAAADCDRDSSCRE